MTTEEQKAALQAEIKAQQAAIAANQAKLLALDVSEEDKGKIDELLKNAAARAYMRQEVGKDSQTPAETDSGKEKKPATEPEVALYGNDLLAYLTHPHTWGEVVKHFKGKLKSDRVTALIAYSMSKGLIETLKKHPKTGKELMGRALLYKVKVKAK